MKPLNPSLTFKHISVHMVHILARLQAKRLVQDQLRSEGVRLSLVSPRARDWASIWHLGSSQTTEW